MIAAVIRWSAHNLLLILICAAAVVAGGFYAVGRISLDAIPDLTDTQVIVSTEWMGRSPQLVEDQITYPLVTSFVSAPSVKTVRGFSMFGMSFVYVIFEDGTDLYWARSRVLEYLSKATGQLPAGVTPTLGPDATGSGWVFQYVLVDATGKPLQELRALPGLHPPLRAGQGPRRRRGRVRRRLREAVPGGGRPREAGGLRRARSRRGHRRDPRLQPRGRRQGGREMGRREYSWVRGRGYIKSIGRSRASNRAQGRPDGTPVLLPATWRRIRAGTGRAARRHRSANGEGEVVGGIALQRFGQNALDVIDNAEGQRSREIAAGLPEGVRN